jgi:hypothetical protein
MPDATILHILSDANRIQDDLSTLPIRQMYLSISSPAVPFYNDQGLVLASFDT